MGSWQDRQGWGIQSYVDEPLSFSFLVAVTASSTGDRGDGLARSHNGVVVTPTCLGNKLGGVCVTAMNEDEKSTEGFRGHETAMRSGTEEFRSRWKTQAHWHRSVPGLCMAELCMTALNKFEIEHRRAAEPSNRAPQSSGTGRMCSSGLFLDGGGVGPNGAVRGSAHGGRPYYPHGEGLGIGDSLRCGSDIERRSLTLAVSSTVRAAAAFSWAGWMLFLTSLLVVDLLLLASIRTSLSAAVLLLVPLVTAVGTSRSAVRLDFISGTRICDVTYSSETLFVLV